MRPDLVVAIPNPRIQKFQTEVLTSEKLKTLYCSCKDMRQSIVISLMYECGLRSHEVVRLRIGDFNNEHRSITIRNSKGNKTLVAPYSHSLRDDLKKYCKATDATPPCTLIE
ncbi:MAG: integrase [Saprospiraceae bacterium]